MKKLALFATGLVLPFLSSCTVNPSAPSTTPGTQKIATKTELFNGRDLNGWQAHLADATKTMEDVWRVENGILICKGEPMGYLHTIGNHTNFTLTVDWRWAPGTTPGNSGILMRVNGRPKPLPRSLEVQLKHENAGDVYGFHGMKLAGDPARFKSVKNHALGGNLVGLTRIQPSEAAPGKWNRAEITLSQGNLTVFINGKKVNEAKDCEITPGSIALQSEGGEIHFKRVSLVSYQ